MRIDRAASRPLLHDPPTKLHSAPSLAPSTPGSDKEEDETKKGKVREEGGGSVEVFVDRWVGSITTVLRCIGRPLLMRCFECKGAWFFQLRYNNSNNNSEFI